MPSFLIFIGAAANIFGAGTYLRDTIKGTTKPNKVTWLLWTAAPLTAAAAAFAAGGGWSVLPILINGLCSLTIFTASLLNKNAYWRLGPLDYLCGLFSVLALVLWLTTREPAVAVLFAILTDLFAALPTLIKAWKHPETETSTDYAMGAFSAATTFFAITVWNVSTVAFPAYIILIDLTLLIFIVRKRFLPTA